MSEMYAFLFCLALGIVARLIFIASSLLAKRTNILPVTVILDTLTVLMIGGAFTLYIIFTGAVLAPYMFAALLSGYLFTYWLTKSSKRDGKRNKKQKAENNSTESNNS